ncbi:MAG: hypothetical protein GY720_22265 [bacterium]|nr:hypothetical protein [bacterium]
MAGLRSRRRDDGLDYLGRLGIFQGRERMKIKRGVKINGAKPELLFGLLICQRVYEEHGVELRVTSICEGRHKRASAHYTGRGADLGTKSEANGQQYGQSLKAEITAGLKEDLGSEFDVILERDHIHVEYDPKE